MKAWPEAAPAEMSVLAPIAGAPVLGRWAAQSVTPIGRTADPAVLRFTAQDTGWFGFVIMAELETGTLTARYQCITC